MLAAMIVGTEWLIEAEDCSPELLRDEARLRIIFDRIMSDLGLAAVGSVWHKFEGEGGVTGLVALTESHLACHTYPEYGTATFNLYCCRERPEWDWNKHLSEMIGADKVTVMRIDRGSQNNNYKASGANSFVADLIGHDTLSADGGKTSYERS